MNKVNYYNPVENLISKLKSFHFELKDSVEFFNECGGNGELEKTLNELEYLFEVELELEIKE
jgi:hypothetical protein